MKVAANEFDGKVVYGQKKINTGKWGWLFLLPAGIPHFDSLTLLCFLLKTMFRKSIFLYFVVVVPACFYTIVRESKVKRFSTSGLIPMRPGSWSLYRDKDEVNYKEPGLVGFKPLVGNRFNTLWFPFINTFSVKNIITFWSKSKINAKIIIVKWFLSTQHPSGYEMVKPSALGLTTPYKGMLCASRVSHDGAQLFQPLLSTNRNEETVL